MPCSPSHEVLAAFDAQVRGRVPRFGPTGAVVEQDGPLVRTHFGTHGTVDHRDLGGLTGTGVDTLISEQQAAFALRGEPVEWKTFAHDTAPLGDRLRAAGFTPGWERSVLVAPVRDIPGPAVLPGRSVRPLGGTDDRVSQRVHDLAARTAPHRIPLAELEADGRTRHREVSELALEADARILGVGWAEFVEGTEFVAIGGMSGPHAEFIPVWARWARGGPGRHRGWNPPDFRFLVAEAADGPLKAALIRSGFQELTTARSYHWKPAGAPASSRPVKRLFDEPEHEALWDRFYNQFAFKPSVEVYPGIREPSASVTWHLAALGDGLDRDAVQHLQRVIESGLLACARPDEPLHWLDWSHGGYRFDPRRVGGPGRPPWPGSAYPDGDYYLYLTADLRLGTFGHPWEESLCVFGEELLQAVEEPLTALLGTVMRRGGRNVGNVWTFGPSDAP
ncbi:DUF2716 domain-containing protein [Streptomyces sp. NBC_01795]|uniref:DUF2716 domain-containing protein n=1 Tax=Streptomyces sp. NBC_01795 TaxID=2975943 RepID=UPI002DDB75ED|nr:DUF2716 domain-containing protein [Streptomyces sp. NBC_01795]WSA90353.1 DUF2716 domain-containing protein [Streptomyces sp. NBC_01795]